MTTTRTFQHQYRQLFARVGRPLRKQDRTLEPSIAAAEKKLGLRLPLALRDYYIIAGRERRLNRAFNELASPKDWELHEGKLMFFAENLGVAYWGVSATSRQAVDPRVFVIYVVSGALDSWRLECQRCSTFLQFMVLMHASFGGGLEHTASAEVKKRLVETLDKEWRFAGEVKKMRAYSREGQVICYSPWRFLSREKQHWRVFAGSSTKERGWPQLRKIWV